jgi:dUTP pyrophosphatase
VGVGCYRASTNQRIIGDGMKVMSPSFEVIEAVPVEFIKLSPNATVPSRKRDTDAGYDLYASEQTIIHKNDVVRVPIGLRVAVPTGWYYTIEGRSGNLMNGLITLRTIIDAGYNGELFAVTLHAGRSVMEVIEVGQRIAQMVLHKQIHATFMEVQSFSAACDTRGINGWHSSGKF